MASRRRNRMPRAVIPSPECRRLAGKRRAAGPPSTTKTVEATSKPNDRSQAAGAQGAQVGRHRRSWCWSLLAVGGVRLRSTTRSTSRTPTRTSRPRPRTSTTPTARPSSASSPSRTATSIALDEMPQNIKDAVVAAENQSLLDRQGHRPQGHPARGVQQRAGNATQGASTITQQYVKILYLTQERSYKRKVKEAILSLKIQRQLSKEEILEGYLNTIYFGRGAYGVQAAAQAYFDKSTPRTSTCGRAPCSPACSTTRPTSTRPTASDAQGGAQGALRLRRSASMAEHRRHHRGARPTRPQRRLPKFPKIEAEDAVRRPEGPHARRWSATSC